MQRLIAAHRGEIESLCRQHHVRRLDVFGSATTDRFNPETSDVDFLVELESLPPREYARAFDGLQQGLEALLGRPVDLVSAKSVVNPYFARSVEATREAVYAAG